MSIYEYKEGEHKAGFVGFRVSVSFGHSDKVKQKYFSLKKLSYADAKHKAQQQEQTWIKEAIDAKKKLRLTTKPRFAKENTILPGLRANITVQKKQRKTGTAFYYRPVFIVQGTSQSKKTKIFPIIKLGYKAAYIKAIGYYANIYDMNSTEKLSLLSKEPSREIFTKFLLGELKKKQHKITKSHLLKLLE